MFGANLSYYSFHTYIQILLILTGCAGNCMTIIVTSRGNLKKNSTSVLLKCLAVADSVILLNLLLEVLQTPFILDTDIVTYTDFVCKLHFYLATWFTFVSNWCLVMITFERHMAVTKPFKMKVWFSKTRSIVTVILLVVLGAGLMAPRIIAQELAEFPIGPNKTLKFCISPNTDQNNYIKLGIIIVDFALPIVIIGAANIFIIRALRKAVKKRAEMQAPGNERQLAKEKQNQQITTMLLFISFFFLVTVTPIAVYLVAHTKIYENNPQFAFSNDNAAWKTITLCVSLNHSCNYIFYVCTGSLFRNELKNLCCKGRNEDTPTVQAS